MVKRLIVIALVACIALSTQASTISVNLAEGDAGAPRANQTVQADELAGHEDYAATNWNNIQVTGADSTELIDDTGTATGAIITYVASNGWGDGSADTSLPDGKIARGYFDDGTTGATTADGKAIGVDIQINDIPYNYYTVVLYMSSDYGTAFTNYMVNGVTKDADPAADGDVYGWTEWILNENCLVFEGFANSPLDIEVLARSADGDSATRGTLAGFQIVSLDHLAAVLSPSNGEQLVNPTATLQWQAPADYTPDQYKLYLRTDDPNFTAPVVPNLIDGKVLAGTVTSLDPGTDSTPELEYETTYYWRIDAHDPGTGTWNEGITSSFTTMPPNPVVTKQPASTTADADGNFTLAIEEINGISYQWNFDGVALADGEQPSGAVVSGATTQTLTVTGATVQQEGQYVCVVTNSSASVDSDPASVWTQRLVSEWNFDGDFTDAVSGFNGEIAKYSVDEETEELIAEPADPNFAPGLTGQAVEFFGDSEHVQIPGSEDFFNFYPTGLTINCWIKTEQDNGAWGGLVCKQNPQSGSAGFVFDLNSTGRASGTIRGAIADQGGTTDVNDNEWHMVTFTWDGSFGRTYQDGVLEKISGEFTGSSIPVSTGMVTMGVERSDGVVPYIGLLDNVQIYTYPLDPYTIAHKYTDVSQTSVCVENPVADFNQDCQVDLLDFAILAQKWLDCNRVPCQ